jgi:hypothetical protein
MSRAGTIDVADLVIGVETLPFAENPIRLSKNSEDLFKMYS